ncbi:hypothetical protein KJ032_26250 [Salmonella enterica subsp. enterica serovar Typhimurium]|nr:hypothetical protein [Salmonella enterica subsp. enterica serovar Typhimurium]
MDGWDEKKEGFVCVCVREKKRKKQKMGIGQSCPIGEEEGVGELGEERGKAGQPKKRAGEKGGRRRTS